LPIGDNNTNYLPVSGIFDGQGFNINGLWINRPADDYQGLFGYVRYGDNNATTIKNIGVNIVNVGVNGNSGVGGLVGDVSYQTTITNCYVTGTVAGNEQIGGLVGTSDQTFISNCYSTCTVDGNEQIGGLVGVAKGMGYDIGTPYPSLYSTTITDCYAIGAVSGIRYIGGLLGNTFGEFYYSTAEAPCVTIANCYATGTITGEEYVGGLVGNAGYGEISNCFAFNCTVEATDNTLGRIAGAVTEITNLTNNFAYTDMELLQNGVQVIFTPNPDDKYGDNISLATAITVAPYTTSGWDMGGTWTLSYAPNYKVKAGTNLPILQVFNKTAFPSAIQYPRVGCEEIGCINSPVIHSIYISKKKTAPIPNAD
jgi:hypothetical protein